MMTIEGLARICHEVNRGLCGALGDDSQVPWEVAPDWQQRSAIDGVRHALDPTKEAHPSGSHEHWVRDKVSHGWTYGDIKSEHKKQHPCLVPFHELPKEQQLKDHLFLTVVKVLS
jgi:hypothetical protein